MGHSLTSFQTSSALSKYASVPSPHRPPVQRRSEPVGVSYQQRDVRRSAGGCSCDNKVASNFASSRTFWSTGLPSAEEYDTQGKPCAETRFQSGLRDGSAASEPLPIEMAATARAIARCMMAAG